MGLGAVAFISLPTCKATSLYELVHREVSIHEVLKVRTSLKSVLIRKVFSAACRKGEKGCVWGGGGRRACH